MGEKIRVVVVDDHPFFRDGVKIFLEGLGTFQVIGAVESGEKALGFVPREKPDVVVMDLQMEGMDGITATAALLEQDATTKVLVLTSFGSDEKIQQALAVGAAGYCLKNAPPSELATAILAVAGGGTYLGRGISPEQLVPARPIPQGSEKGNKALQLADLTDREIDVLKLLAKGLGNREIAEQLVITEKTVKTHVANVLQKLGVKTRTQAAIKANQLGVT